MSSVCQSVKAQEEWEKEVPTAAFARTFKHNDKFATVLTFIHIKVDILMNVDIQCPQVESYSFFNYDFISDSFQEFLHFNVVLQCLVLCSKITEMRHQPMNHAHVCNTPQNIRATNENLRT